MQRPGFGRHRCASAGPWRPFFENISLFRRLSHNNSASSFETISFSYFSPLLVRLAVPRVPGSVPKGDFVSKPFFRVQSTPPSAHTSAHSPEVSVDEARRRVLDGFWLRAGWSYLPARFRFFLLLLLLFLLLLRSPLFGLYAALRWRTVKRLLSTPLHTTSPERTSPSTQRISCYTFSQILLLCGPRFFSN